MAPETPITGDAELARTVGDLLGPRHPVFAAAVVDGEEARQTVVGAPPEADFEVGSITKGVTGLLYFDALDRGEVAPTTRLGDLLPLGDTPVAGVTLGPLSQHRSGLASLPRGMRPLRRTIELWREGTNPYREDLDQLLALVRQERLKRPKPRYSNLGYQLFGHALAAAAGVPYRTLVAERIADPLGLEVFYIPYTSDELRPEALTGNNRKGRPRDPWTGEGLAPAGGVRSSIGTMAAFMSSLLDGTCPGLGALDPTAKLGPGARVGAAWITIESKGTEVTFHNGGTGGFRSWLGLDRKSGQGAVVLSATSVSVDKAGTALLTK